MVYRRAKPLDYTGTRSPAFPGRCPLIIDRAVSDISVNYC